MANTFDPHGKDDLSLPPDGKAGDTAAQVQDSAGRDNANLASDVIREKLKSIYAEEPNATHELAQAAARDSSRSKHQQFMYELSASGKDLATVQTEWHKYYEGLPDEEKHTVWREFYASQAAVTPKPLSQPADSPQTLARHKNQVARGRSGTAGPGAGIRSTKDIQKTIRDKVSAGGKLQPKHHLQSLLFGLGMGLIVIIIFLFGFFNEVVIAPFIQPSRVSAATPLIVGDGGIAPTPTPEVIIPKINVEIPVDYSQTTTNEADIENALEGGVVHYPTTALPGHDGNAAFFGHSSNNIFNKGKYKFAFVLLHTLRQGDIFYLTYNKKVYIYKVIDRRIVEPSDVGVLNSIPGQTATATLITCDPPGTSLHRLVVVGQQISPDPATNAKAANPPDTETAPTTLPGNGPTLWGRFIGTTIGKVIVGAVLLGLGLWAVRRLNDRLTVK